MFVLPVFVVLVVIRQALQITADVLRPIAHLMPTEKVVGLVVVDLLAIAAIVVLCFLAGLLVGTRLGRRISNRLEHLILRKVPGYTLFKGAAYGLAGLEAKSELSVALARIEDAWMLAFVVERHASGLFTVFVPSAPTPAAGSIYYLPADRVKLLDVPVADAMACVMRLGIGSRELLEHVSLEPPLGPPAAGSEPGK